MNIFNGPSLNEEMLRFVKKINGRKVKNLRMIPIERGLFYAATL